MPEVTANVAWGGDGRTLYMTASTGVYRIDLATAGAVPGNPVVVMETTMGNVTMELFADQAPVSVSNFLQYAYAGFYEDTVFHRVIENFMIQGGGMGANLVPKITPEAIVNEATNGLSNRRGTVAMARTAAVNSATSQFFINHANNGGRGLDHRGTAPDAYGYAVFGEVVDGMDVVDAIAGVQTTAHRCARERAGHAGGDQRDDGAAVAPCTVGRLRESEGRRRRVAGLPRFRANERGGGGARLAGERREARRAVTMTAIARVQHRRARSGWRPLPDRSRERTWEEKIFRRDPPPDTGPDHRLGHVSRR